MFKKIFDFVKSRLFITAFLLCCIFLLSILFWFWGSLIAFNDIYIFSSSFLRFSIILIIWLIVFLFFLLKPIINFISSLKSEKRLKFKVLKKKLMSSFTNLKETSFYLLKMPKKHGRMI